MIAFVHFQLDYKYRQEVRATAAIVAMSLPFIHFFRAVVGLWQLHVFRNWMAVYRQCPTPALQTLGRYCSSAPMADHVRQPQTNNRSEPEHVPRDCSDLSTTVGLLQKNLDGILDGRRGRGGDWSGRGRRPPLSFIPLEGSLSNLSNLISKEINGRRIINQVAASLSRGVRLTPFPALFSVWTLTRDMVLAIVDCNRD